MMTTFLSKTRLAAAAASLMLALAAQNASAITVVWSAPEAINSNADIINPGNVIRAVNFAPSSQPASIDVNVGGNIIAFTQAGVTGGTGFFNTSFFDDNNPAAGTVDADFHQVLDSFRDNSTTSVTISGLVAGETYFVQAFQSDDRGNRTTTWNINGIGTSFASNTSLFRSAFAIATVTLDGGETSFTFERPGGAGNQVNAVVVTQAPASNGAIPEPATAVMAGMMLVGLAARKRRSRVA